MNSFYIRIVNLASGQPTTLSGQYVVSLDQNAQDGFGLLETTHWRGKAKAFDTYAEAFDYWQQQSTVRPRRDDNRPNRPLTAYTVEILQG